MQILFFISLIHEDKFLLKIWFSSFWCNRTDSCDNDGVFAYSQCQPKKTVYNYCEDSNECRQTEGLICYPDRNQCDCSDLVNNYWSNASLTCLPKRSFHEWCTESLECLDRQNLECDLAMGRCECKNVTYE